MASVNKVILVGHLGKDPEIKHLEGDNVVANVSIATTEAYKDRSGNRVENTEWHDLEIWGQQARIAEQYLRKGSQVFVEGKIKTEKWEKDGHKFSRTKVRVTSFTMLGSKSNEGQTNHQTHHDYPIATSEPTNNNPVPAGMDLTEDDLPF